MPQEEGSCHAKLYSKRKRSNYDDSSASSSNSKKKKKAKKLENSRKKSYSSTDSTSDSEGYSRKKQRKKHKHKKKSKHKKADEPSKHKHKSRKKSKHKEVGDEELMVGPVIKQSDAVTAETAKGPMTKEMWEKQQNVVRRVYDADTGRTRLVKGSGEIIEEIVSKEQQKQINKMATKGDGISYSLQTGTLR